MVERLKNITGKDIKEFLGNNAITIMIIIMALYVGLTKDNFFTWGNMHNLAKNTSIRFLVAMGVSGCLITKGTDLSAGRQIGFAACIAGTLLQRADYASKFFPDLAEYPLLAVIIGVVALTALIGIFNGIIIAYFKVPPFITTLGTQTLVYGVTLIYSRAEPIGGFRPEYSNLSSGQFLNISYLIWFTLIVAVIMWFIYNFTRHGKYMYAIGGNENAAEVSGVNTNAVKIRIYATASILYALAGILLAPKSGGASVNLGQGWELEAIAACTIGGVSTNGGVGKISGILIGVLVFEVLKTSLQFLGVETNYTYIAQGAVIIIAVAMDIRKYVAKK